MRLGFFIVFIAVGVAHGANSFDVRAHGAKGDGQALETSVIQKAIDACRAAGGGQITFPAGRYLSGTIHLRSGVALHLETGARLIGTTNLNEYRQPAVPEFMPEARWGKWHRALILGENVEDVAITGPGVIDGNKVLGLFTLFPYPQPTVVRCPRPSSGSARGRSPALVESADRTANHGSGNGDD